MAPLRPRDIGTRAESAVVAVLRPIWPGAERRALRGTQDAGDITGTPGITWSVKGGKAARRASDRSVAGWMGELARMQGRTGDPVGVLVVQRPGYGSPRAAWWWAVMTTSTLGRVVGAARDVTADVADAPVRLHLITAMELLRASGHGGVS